MGTRRETNAQEYDTGSQGLGTQTNREGARSRLGRPDFFQRQLRSRTPRHQGVRRPAVGEPIEDRRGRPGNCSLLPAASELVGLGGSSQLLGDRLHQLPVRRHLSAHLQRPRLRGARLRLHRAFGAGGRGRRTASSEERLALSVIGFRPTARNRCPAAQSSRAASRRFVDTCPHCARPSVFGRRS